MHQCWRLNCQVRTRRSRWGGKTVKDQRKGEAEKVRKVRKVRGSISDLPNEHAPGVDGQPIAMGLSLA
jgi:hypothetical protein